MNVEAPVRLPPPPELGRLGEWLAWLAGAQGAWPPHAPRQLRRLNVATGEGLVAGRAEADALADAGVDLLALEASADVSTAVAVICALLDVEPVLALGTAADPAWSQRVVAVRDQLRLARPHVGDPERLVADPVLGRVTGLLEQAAVRRTPVVLGGSPLLAAGALVAERLSPGARRWWLASTAGASTGTRLALADLGLDPVLDLGLTTAGGARLAAGLLINGVDLVTEPEA